MSTTVRSKCTLDLLPGMDGTGRMFEGFLPYLPESVDRVVVSFPTDRPMGYSELESVVEAALPASGPFVLLGESFSGPLALRIAAAGHPRLVGVVLVASFARVTLSKFGSSLRRLVGTWMFRLALPKWAIRRFLAGADAPPNLISDLQATVQSVSPSVMAHRVQEVLAVDARPLLPQIRVPVLLLSAGRDRLISSNTVHDFEVLGDRFECISIDAPHLILQCRPAEASRFIQTFIMSCTAVDEGHV
jgi:pimeloyl-[acyl-carrier protein] methyl ester esterase